MEKELFTLVTFNVTPLILLELLFEKETNWAENDSCYLRMVINKGEENEFFEMEKVRFVFEDQAKLDPLIETTMKLVQNLIAKVDAIDSGLHLLSDFYVKFPGISNSNIEIRREVKRQLASLNEYKITPFVIDLYSNYILNYKGSDTLQARKHKQGIQGMIDAQNCYNRMGGTYGLPR